MRLKDFDDPDKSDSVSQEWKDIKANQQDRRTERVERRIKTIESWEIPFRRLNGDFHLRFTELDDWKVVDYYPVHSIIYIREYGKKARKRTGIDTLKEELGLT